MSEGVSKAHAQFEDNQIYYKAFNYFFGTWALVQSILYFVSAGRTQCTEASLLLIAYGLSEITLLISIAGILIATYLYKYFTVNYFLIGFTCIAKCLVIASIIAYVWHGFETCYIPYSLKIVIIIMNALEIVILAIQVILMKRVKKAHREIKIQKLVKSKTFLDY